MSYNVRDDSALLGPGAAVEIPNGAGASTIAQLQVYELVGIFGATGGASGTNPSNFIASTDYTVFIAPPGPSQSLVLPALGFKYQVVGVSVFYSTAAAGAATLAIEICPAGTANGSGNNVLAAATFALNTVQSNTPFNLTLNTNIDNLTISTGGRLNFNAGATATTGLVDLTIAAYLIKVG